MLTTPPAIVTLSTKTMHYLDLKDLHAPPVPITELKWGTPNKGDYYFDATGWQRCHVGFSESQFLHFTPAPQPPKSVPGIKAGVRVQKISDGIGYYWRLSNSSSWVYVPRGYAPNIYHYGDFLDALPPEITDFTTTEDG